MESVETSFWWLVVPIFIASSACALGGGLLVGRAIYHDKEILSGAIALTGAGLFVSALMALLVYDHLVLF